MAEVLTYRCPFCDCEVRVGQPCPGCAKKEAGKRPRQEAARKSWEQDSASDGLDLPDEDFDYDEFAAREFGHAPHRKLGIKWYWWLLALALLAGMLVGLLR